MQEAYRPPCSEYSFCCPNWVLPRPDLAWGGGITPGPGQDGGVPCQGEGTLPGGQDRGAGYPPSSVRLWQGTLHPDLAGYPPR